MTQYKIKNGFNLFWGGPYSQWSIYPFIFNNIQFNCNEQFMMYGKSLVCGDRETAELIMKEKDPSSQKKLGRKVKGYSDDIWNEEKSMMVVYIANYFKFTQNTEAYNHLMNDPSNEIVEASPYDRIWGIGLSADRPQSWNKNSWRGENRLGRCIDQVRKYEKYALQEDIDYHNKAIKFCYELMS